MYVVCIYKPMWQHTICCTVASCYCLCLILYICVLDATVLYMLTTCSIVVNLLCCIYRGHTERIRRKGTANTLRGAMVWWHTWVAGI